MIINLRKISNTGLLLVIECFYTVVVVVVVLLPFKWSEHFFHHWCLIMYFQILYLVLTTQSSVNNKHAPQGKKFETMVLASAPAAWWMMAVLRTTCFVGPLTSRSKKKKKCETMGLISLVGSPEPSVLRIRERSTITTKHLWKDQEKHLPTSLSSPSGVLCVLISTGTANDLWGCFTWKIFPHWSEFSMIRFWSWLKPPQKLKPLCYWLDW